MSKQLTTDEMREYQRRRRAMTDVKPDVLQDVKPENVKPDCKALPQYILDDIASLTAWCKARGIEDDTKARIERAIAYQRYKPDQNKALNADKTIITDAVGKQHNWPAVLDTVNTTGLPTLNGSIA